MKKVLFIVFVIGLAMYHGFVIKAERNYEARIYGQWRDGKISEEEYQKLKKEDGYFKHAFNVKEVFTSWD